MKIMENGHPDISEANSESTDIDPYENKYYALLRRCENVQQSNERLVHRLYRIKGILRRLRHERRFLMRRLDQHEDNYRDVPLKIPLGLDDDLTSSTIGTSSDYVNTTSANSSSFGFHSQPSEQEVLRNDASSLHGHLSNARQSPSPNWSQSLPSTSIGPVTASTPNPILPTSKRKRNDKSTSKSVNKKTSVTAATNASSVTSTGVFLKNALTDYGHLPKLSSDPSEAN